MRKGFFRLCCGLCVVVILVTFVGCGTRESRARKHHQKGLLYARNLRLTEAAEHFEKAIRLDPNNYKTHYELARVYLTQRRLVNAEKEFRRAIEIRPDYMQGHLGLAETLHAEKKTEQAIEACQAALQINPDDGQVHGLLGKILILQGRSEEGIAQFRLALEKQPDLVEIRAALARELLSAGKTDEARQAALTIVAEYDTDNFDAHMLLSGIYEREKQYEKAIEEAKTALRGSPGKPSPHLALALLYLKTSQPDLALKEAEQAMQSRSTQSAARFVRGSVLLHQGKFSEAVVDLQSAVREHPDWVEARYRLAQALYKGNRPEMAAAEYETLLRQLPEFEQARLQLALIALEQGWFSDAEFHCKQVLDRNPTQKDALQCLVRTYEVQGKTEQAAAARGRLAAVVSGDQKGDMQVALEMLARGDADGAIEKCRKAMESKPDDVGLLNLLGSAYIQKGELDKAAGQFQRAVEVDPSSISSYLNLSSLLMMQKKYDEAAAQCRLASVKNPESPAPHYRLGTIHRLQGEREDALKEFQAAAELDPKDFFAHDAVVDILLTQKQYDDALTYCQKLIERLPSIAKPHELAARVHLARAQLDKAVVELEKALEKDKSLSSARVMLAKTYLRQNKSAEARKEAQQVLRLARDAPADRVFADLAPVYEQVGDFEGALADVRALLDEDGDNPAAKLMLAYLRYLAKQPSQAAKEAEDFLAAGVGVAPANYILGCVRADQGNLSEAVVRFRDAVRLRPDWVDARLKLSAVLRAERHDLEAVEELKSILERLPDNLPALVAIADLELKAGLLDSARTHSSRAAELDPTNFTALRLLGDTHVAQGNLEEAEKVYNSMQTVAPAAASAPAFVAAAQLSSRKPDEAIATCQKAISEGSKDERVYNVLGLAQLFKGLHSDAASSFQEALTLDPDFLSARINLARAFRAMGKRDQEAAELGEVLSRNPKAAWVRARLGEALASQEKYVEAAAEFETAFKDSGNDIGIALLAGQNYLILKDHQNAKKMYELVVASTENPTLLASAYNNLAWIASIEGKDLAQALSFATRANELKPNDENVLDTIGWILYNLGRHAEACEKLTSAVARAPDNPLIRYHLGMAMFKDGRKEQSLQQLKKAVSLSPTFEGVEEAKRVIAELEKQN